MTRLTRRKTVLLITAAIAVVGVTAVGVWWLLSSRASESKMDPVAEQAIHTYAEPIKAAEKYSELPETKREDFLKKEAVRLGFDPTKEVAPETMTIHCMDIYTSKLYKMAQQYGDEVYLYQTALNHAQMEIRDTCYANYDPDGKILPEEMPHMQAH
ncbi:hypothetical protein EYC58_02395 [Candidatus Saccharibacteria bacterium]|nr:MAG: hypothetical protein EYC58_02395 [Candidatus Saccharibacteria bacterium]